MATLTVYSPVIYYCTDHNPIMYRIGVFTSRRYANLAVINFAVENDYFPSQNKEFVAKLCSLSGETEESLHKTCKKYGIDYIKIEQEPHIKRDGGWGIDFCSEGQWTIKYEKFRVDQSLVIDRLQKLEAENNELKKKLADN